MKQPLRFMTAPKSFWDNEQLSIVAKFVAITIDSYVDNPHGTAMGIRAIQTATNISAKEVKDAMTELYEHGAMEVTVCDGQKFWKPLLYRDSYPKVGEKPVIGDKPTDSDPIDYAYIQDKWNEICYDLPKLERMTPSRKSRVRSVLKQADLSVDDFIKCFKIIACTPFLSGQTDKFRATFDWLTANSKNATKVWEGFYSRTYQEKRDHELIRNGGEVNQKQDSSEDFYR